jgi:methyl-accepting chemotaxis protein
MSLLARIHSRFSAAPLAAKLLGMVAVFALPLARFAALRIADAAGDARQAARLERLVAFDAHLTELVHHLQRERGLTGLYLGSAGAKADGLSEQRPKTDKALPACKSARAGLDTGEHPAALVAAVKAVDARLTDLSTHRATVDELTVKGREGLGFYTKLNALALDVLTIAEPTAGDPLLRRRLAAQGAFLRAKEATGIERGTMSKA